MSQNKLLAAERDRSVKELDLLRDDNACVKAKNVELEGENHALEQALRELHKQSESHNCVDGLFHMAAKGWISLCTYYSR